MAPSKFLGRRVSDLVSQPAPKSLETVDEVEVAEGVLKEKEHHEEVPQRQVNMLSPQQRPPLPSRLSRLQRLSSFLPILRTESKLQKDHPRKPVPRKQVPSQHREPSPNAPTQPPPTAPVFASPFTPAPVPPSTPTSNRLHKAGSPPQAPPAQSADPHTITQGRRRGNSLVLVVQSEIGHARAVSSPVNSGPTSYHSEGEGGSNAISKLRRRSWMPGGSGGRRSRSSSRDNDEHAPIAWVNATGHKIDYNINLLLAGEKVPEMWNEAGDTYVYLFPRESGRGPSFKVSSLCISSSHLLLNLLHGDIYSGRAHGKSFDDRESLSVEDATRHHAIRNIETPPYTPSMSERESASDGSAESLGSFSDLPSDKHLYFPVGITALGPQFTASEIQSLIDARNLFAILTGQPVVASRIYRSQFRVFLSIAAMLKKFEFANFDGSTYGESASQCFGYYLDEQHLADVRDSREATIEGLILGEQMRSVELYNEAFAHAVGKYSAIKGLNSPLFDEVSTITHSRLENASRQLNTRQKSAEFRLTDFDFPSLFAGIGSSATAEESKIVRFQKWKSSYLSFRKLVLSYYKDLHGQWPPKASSKKNNFSENGLNRLVLKCLYADLSGLYDYLVDTKALTTRAYDASDDQDATNVAPAAAALRKLLGEFDRSSPPVQPPIPFDIPLIPTIGSVDATYQMLSPKDQHKANTRKLKDHESTLILTKSHNLHADFKTPFLEMYKDFEQKESKGKNVQELAEQRIGHWIFLYAVIQSLPLLVVDAPGLKFTDGVEYFLCMPPMGSSPWIEDAPGVKMGWYEVRGGGGVVSLPDDVVSYGVEATYRRSHCWVMGEKWIGSEPDVVKSEPVGPETLSPLSPPPGFVDGELGLRASVRGRERSTSPTGQRSQELSPSPHPRHRSHNGQSTQSMKRDSVALGLERLPLPPTLGAGENWSPVGSRPTSRAGSPMIYPGGRRTQSRGGDTPTSGGANTGATFDDILSGMDHGVKDRKGDKKGKKK